MAPARHTADSTVTSCLVLINQYWENTLENRDKQLNNRLAIHWLTHVYEDCMDFCFYEFYEWKCKKCGKNVVL